MSGIGHLALGAMQGLNAADAYYARRNSEKLAQAADQRDQTRFDMQTEAFDLEKEVKRRETAGQKLYALSLDDQGNPRKFSAQDNDYINRQVVPILNQGGIFNEFFTSNKDVDPENPIATAHINEDNRVMIGLRMRDGSVRPATENKSSDPNDNLWSPSVEEFMRYAQIEADPRGAAARLAARQQRSQGMADFKAQQGILTDERLRLAKGYGVMGMTPTGGEKKTEAEDGAKNANKVMRKNGNWVTESTLESEFVTKYGRVDPVMGRILNPDAPDYYEWRNKQVDPQYAVSVDDKEGNKSFAKLPKGQQNALAIEWLKKEKVQPEGSGMFDFGEQDYSSQQIDLAKAKMALEQKSVASTPNANVSGQSATASSEVQYKGKLPNGKTGIFTKKTIEKTAQETGLSEEAVMRQLGIK